ncbi:MAG TPA: hypothetical protein VNY05_37565 [Candidatus Acidoferrales bacterium]|jgi:hypothetical protein|nr:hypothetical protein [Candidatus Acidoferrales bacterium]
MDTPKIVLEPAVACYNDWPEAQERPVVAPIAKSHPEPAARVLLVARSVMARI